MKGEIRVDAYADFTFNQQEIIWLRAACARVLHGPRGALLPEYIKFIEELYNKLLDAP